MNLDVFKQKLIKKTIKQLSWREDDDSNADDLYLSTTIFMKQWPMGADMHVHCDKDGCMMIFFCFGGLGITETNLKLINHFNCNVSFLHAYIGEGRNNYLRVEYGVTECVSDDKMVSEITRTIDMLLEDNTMRYLEPLLIICK